MTVKEFIGGMEKYDTISEIVTKDRVINATMEFYLENCGDYQIKRIKKVATNFERNENGSPEFGIRYRIITK